MTWWLWLLLGMGLLAGEMLTPGGFYFAFFGVGAILTGLLARLGLVSEEWVQWLLFTAISLASLVPFRSRLVRWAAADTAGGPVDTLVGEEVLLLEDVASGGSGRAELRGTTWNVRTSGARTLRRGDRARVARVEGLTLWVESAAAGAAKE